jgi:hypothetical protein
MPSTNQEEVEKALAWHSGASVVKYNNSSGTFLQTFPARGEVSDQKEASTLILTVILFFL